MWEVAAAAVLVMVIVASASLALDIAPKDPQWRRIWAWFAYGMAGIFILWMIILFGFIK